MTLFRLSSYRLCLASAPLSLQVKIDDWESVPKWNESAMMQAVTMRPVVTAVCCGNNIDDW